MTLLDDDEFERVVHDAWKRASPAQRRWIEALGQQSDRNGARQGEWLQELAALGTELCGGGDAHWAVVGMFWIRLVGVFNLQEIAPAYVSLAANVAKEPRMSASRIVKAFMAIYDSLVAVRTALTDDEIICIDYLRQVAAHPRQSSYEVRYVRKDDRVNEERHLPYLDRDIPVDEVRRIHERLMREHSGERGLAKHVAGKIREHVARAIEAIDDANRLT